MLRYTLAIQVAVSALFVALAFLASPLRDDTAWVWWAVALLSGLTGVLSLGIVRLAKDAMIGVPIIILILASWGSDAHVPDPVMPIIVSCAMVAVARARYVRSVTQAVGVDRVFVVTFPAGALFLLLEPRMHQKWAIAICVLLLLAQCALALPTRKRPPNLLAA